VGNATPAFDGEFCEARWGDRNTWPSVAYDVWHSCLDAVDEAQVTDEQQLCEYYLHEVAVAFYDTCVQPGVLALDDMCAGFDSDGSPPMVVSGFQMGPGELRWDEVSTDYYDTYLADGGGGCACADMNTINHGDFQITDSYDHYENEPPSPYVTRELVDTVPSVKFISPVATITSPQVAGGLGGAQPHQFRITPAS
jgi:hypothetical protein